MNELPTKPPQDMSYIIQTTKDGHLDSVCPESHVGELVARALASNLPIVIHLHGGLVPKESAYESVNFLQPKYVEAQLFPIFIVWRTGIFDAIKNAEELVHRPLFAKLLERLLKYLVSKYALDGKPKGIGQRREPDSAEVEEELFKRDLGELPYPDVRPQPTQPDMSEDEQRDFLKSLANDDELQQEWTREIQAPKTSGGEKSLGIRPDIRSEALVEGETRGKAIGFPIVLAKYALLIAAQVVKRYFKHRDHRLYTTIVEEILRQLYVDLIGTEVWQFMKQDSEDTFEHEGENPLRGGWLLMRLLGAAAKQRAAAGKELPRISIVGHSAGCIYATNLLRYLYRARESSTSDWNGLPFKLDKLVFLAPAATCKTLSAMLRLHDKKALFGSFRMFSLNDEDEHAYFEVPVLYSGSLLYIISGLLESEDDAGSHDMPIVGMQRFARTAHPFEEPDVLAVWKFLNGGTHQLVWSGASNGPGLSCDSKKHGEFTRTPATVASFLYFLNR